MTSVAPAATIPHSRPFFGREEIDALTRVVESRHIAQGKEVERLEAEWSAATGVRGSVCVGSGLAALRLALHAVGVTSGSEVIVPAYSCVSILNAVLALSAVPVLADVLDGSWTMDPQSAASLRSPRTSAIVAVHLFGSPAPIAGLSSLGAPVIEDCAHGIGGFAGGKPFGAAATASIASFYATKMIAAGEGGVVASDNDEILAVVRNARNPSDQRPDGAHLNDKLTDLEAAIARAQLTRLSWTLHERAVRAERYDALLRDLLAREWIELPVALEGRVWYRYPVVLRSRTAADVAAQLHRRGVDADQPVWDLRGVVAWRRELSVSNRAFDRVLSLPLYPDLTETEQERVCETLREVLSS